MLPQTSRRTSHVLLSTGGAVVGEVGVAVVAVIPRHLLLSCTPFPPRRRGLSIRAHTKLPRSALSLRRTTLSSLFHTLMS